MGKDSSIQWTHHTFNPWWGCVKVSPGCVHCYAETFAKRTGNSVWGVDASRRFFGDKHWREPHKWNTEAEKVGERRRVFCASMADVFEDRDDLNDQRRRLWDVIETTPALDWLLLTKRPENITRMIDPRWLGAPRPNVWFGTTAEDQDRLNKRIHHLRAVPAAVRFLSCEPLIGAVELTHPVDWVIIGGESGGGAREMQPVWAQHLINQCRGIGVPVFMKQTGAVLARAWKLQDRAHGGDINEWPEWMRVREFPHNEVKA